MDTLDSQGKLTNNFGNGQAMTLEPLGYSITAFNAVVFYQAKISICELYRRVARSLRRGSLSYTQTAQ